MVRKLPLPRPGTGPDLPYLFSHLRHCLLIVLIDLVFDLLVARSIYATQVYGSIGKLREVVSITVDRQYPSTRKDWGFAVF